MEQNQIINTEQTKEEVVAPSNVIQDMVLFRTEDEQVAVEVIFYNESVWLTQEQMAQLFRKAKSTINEHIGNIYREQELEKEATIHKFGNSEFMKKATYEYKKYQARTLSDVEQSFLQTVLELEHIER